MTDGEAFANSGPRVDSLLTSERSPSRRTSFRTHLWRSGVVLLCWTSALTNLAAGEMRAAPELPGEVDVKAAFVLNFLRLVNWGPVQGEQNPDLLPVCVLAKSEFATAVRHAASGKIVGNRTITIRIDPEPDPVRCRVLLVDSTQYELARGVLRFLGNAPVLTVGNGAGFVQLGGMFDLFVEDRKVQFDAGLTAIRSAKLDVSARLLNLSRNLRKGSSGAEH